MATKSRIRIIPDKMSIKKISDKLRRKPEEIMMALELFGYEVADYMRNIITTSKKDSNKDPSKPTIEGTIDVEVSSNRTSVGIVNIDKLDKEVGYWRLINNGGQVPGIGHFVPGGYGDGTERPEPGMHGGNFFYDLSVNGGFRVTPGMVIPAMNFVERTEVWAKRNS